MAEDDTTQQQNPPSTLDSVKEAQRKLDEAKYTHAVALAGVVKAHDDAARDVQFGADTGEKAPNVFSAIGGAAKSVWNYLSPDEKELERRKAARDEYYKQNPDAEAYRLGGNWNPAVANQPTWKPPTPTPPAPTPPPTPQAYPGYNAGNMGSAYGGGGAPPPMGAAANAITQEALVGGPGKPRPPTRGGPPVLPLPAQPTPLDPSLATAPPPPGMPPPPPAAPPPRPKTAVEAYLEAKQRGMDDMQAAQKAAEANQRLADLSAGLTRAMGYFTHTNQEPRVQEIYAGANAPISDLLMRQGYANEAAKEGLLMTQLQQLDEANERQRKSEDPTDPSNRMLTRLVQATAPKLNIPDGIINGSNWKSVWEALEGYSKAQKEGDEKERADAEQKLKEALVPSEISKNKSEAARNYAEAEKAKEGAGPNEAALTKATALRSALDAADEIERLAKKVGVGATVQRGNISNNLYDNAILKAAQSEAQFTTGQRSGNDKIIEQYRHMYPGWSGFGKVANSSAAMIQAAQALRQRARNAADGLNRDSVAAGHGPVVTDPRLSGQAGPQPGEEGKPVTMKTKSGKEVEWRD